MLFADAEGFWKSPNLYDAVGVVGFVVGIASIWFSWWLAKRDISEKVNEAIRRVAANLLLLDLAEVAQSARMAKEACVGRQWTRAREKMADCRGLLNRVVVQDIIQESMKPDLNLSIDLAIYLEVEMAKMTKTGSGSLSNEVLQRLDDLISTIQRIDGRLRNTLWE